MTLLCCAVVSPLSFVLSSTAWHRQLLGARARVAHPPHSPTPRPAPPTPSPPAEEAKEEETAEAAPEFDATAAFAAEALPGATEGYDAYGYNPSGGFETAAGFEAAAAPAAGFEAAAAPEFAAAPAPAGY